MKRGFSLIEVMLALAVVAVGVLAIVGSVIFATRSQAAGGRATVAIYLANQISDLSKLYHLPKLSPLNDGPALRMPVDAPPFASEVYANDLFRRNVRMTHLDPAGTTYQAQLYQIDISIFWWEKSGEKSISISSIYRAP